MRLIDASRYSESIGHTDVVRLSAVAGYYGGIGTRIQAEVLFPPTKILFSGRLLCLLFREPHVELKTGH